MAAKVKATFWSKVRRWAGIATAIVGTAGAIGLAASFNVAAVEGRGSLAVCGGIALVLGAAAFVHGALHSGWPLPLRIGLGMAAALLVYTSWTNAKFNLSVISAAHADKLQTVANDAEKAKGDRASLEAQRSAQVEIAGWVKPEAIESKIAAEKAAAGRAWSEDCKSVSVGRRDKCNQATAKVLNLKAQLEAAKERDRLTHDLAEFDKKPPVKEAKASAAVVDAQNEGIFAASVELIAALAPTLLFGMLVHGKAPAVKSSPKIEKKKKKDETGEQHPADTFASNRLEHHKGSFVTAGEMRKAFVSDHGNTVSQKAVTTRLKELGFEHEDKNGRPGWRNVRIKPVASIRLATSDTWRKTG